jgi:hypothetical protein
MKFLITDANVAYTSEIRAYITFLFLTVGSHTALSGL